MPGESTHTPIIYPKTLPHRGMRKRLPYNHPCDIHEAQRANDKFGSAHARFSIIFSLRKSDIPYYQINISNFSNEELISVGGVISAIMYIENLGTIEEYTEETIAILKDYNTG